MSSGPRQPLHHDTAFTQDSHRDFMERHSMLVVAVVFLYFAIAYSECDLHEHRFQQRQECAGNSFIDLTLRQVQEIAAWHTEQEAYVTDAASVLLAISVVTMLLCMGCSAISLSEITTTEERKLDENEHTLTNHCGQFRIATRCRLRYNNYEIDTRNHLIDRPTLRRLFEVRQRLAFIEREQRLPEGSRISHLRSRVQVRLQKR